MKITRRFTTAGKDVFETVQWTRRSSRIANLDGSIVFEMNDAEVPSSWSQLATDIMVSKYFRKAGVPQQDESGNILKDANGKVITGPERSVRQVIHRLVGCWTHWGREHNYFDTHEDAESFYDELCYMLLNQMAAPNSPQWFNTGLNWAYGINGPAQGHYYTDPKTGQTLKSDDAYTHPQPHACFIQSISDDLVNPGGIMDLWVREARLFKYGSGTGTNFSKIRGAEEPLSGGGRSSGLMSFLKIGDRAAGAIKSGGTTRRAAKMVCLDLDHPDIESFVNWKVREEIKVAAMVEGMKHLDENQKEQAAKLALELGYDFNGEAYQTVSGQNSNNSVRIPNRFFHCLDEDGEWDLTYRTGGAVARSMRAADLWDQIGYAAWRCADPGVQFDSTINQWHTCPDSGAIHASNPCSEYMFLDNTACNLASLNILKFYDTKRRHFDIDAYEHGVRLWTVVLEISVLMAQYPSREIARLSHEYRTLGLGYANLGAMLMQAGIPYDSDLGRSICGCLTAIMTGRCYATSAELAHEHGPFRGYYYRKNRDHMLRVIRNHRRAAYGVPREPEKAREHVLGNYEELEIPPVPIDDAPITGSQFEHLGGIANGGELVNRARHAWDEALAQGDQHGYRNAQVSVIAPTGTIGLLMDCDTTGVEPDFALVKFKKLAGGGYFKIANQSLKPSLESLGYSPRRVREILTYVMGKLTLDVPMPDKDGNVQQDSVLFTRFLRDAGFTDSDLGKINESLPMVFELQYAFSPWSLDPKTIEKLGLTEQVKDPKFNLLRALGLTAKQLEVLNRTICGSQTVEGSPGLKEEHLAVFDCANRCGPYSSRYIVPEGHIHMMAATQPFISGAISKTINLPNSASVDQIKNCYRLSWELGLKANALYRDGCKLSQPLNTRIDEVDEVEDEEGIESGKEEIAAEVVSVADRAVNAEKAGSDSREIRQIEKVVERIVHRPMRRRLPDTRRSLTHKFSVAGHEGYLTVGLYEDGSPGELFLTMAKEGSTVGGLMDSLGTAISVALQYGVPVESLVTKFTHQRFEPAGMTHNPDIPFAKSLVDYIFRWLGIQFIPGYRAANTPDRGGSKSTAVTEQVGEPSSPASAKAESIARGNGDEKKHDNGGKDSKADNITIVDAGRRIRSIADKDRRTASANAPGSIRGVKTSDRDSETVPDPTSDNALVVAMRDMQEDAPACDVCGTITVRNGTCYKCMNCGNSMGCS